MTKTCLFAVVLLLTTAVGAQAQGSRMTPQDNAANGGAGIRSGNITSTGATVPNPGASQSAGTTSMDRGIQSRDNQIDTSICKGC